jgi:hypothetical protein
MVATSIDYDDKMIVVSCGCIQQFDIYFQSKLKVMKISLKR